MNEPKPDLAIFIPFLSGGGVARVMLDLAAALACRGLKVELVVSRADGRRSAQVPPNITLVDLNSWRVHWCLWGVFRYLRTRRPRLMITAPNWANLIALWARGLARVSVPIIVTEHANLKKYLNAVPPLRRRLMRPAMRLTYPFADSVVAVSEDAADELGRTIGLDRHRINVIYNGTDTRALRVQAQDPVDHPWFAVNQPPVILAAGRLRNEQKDFPTLLRAFAHLRHSLKARLVILGEGPDEESLRSLARELKLEPDFELLGWVANPYKYMKRASVLALPSRWEGLPTVLLEAMALGTQVVSTDCPSGPREILENGKWGTLVPVGDHERLAEAICDILSGRRRYEGMDGRVDAAFGIDRFADSYLRLFPDRVAAQASCYRTRSLVSE